VLEYYLRQFCNYQQNDWVELLPFAEYAHNTAVSEATKISPFYDNYGYQPETQWVGVKEEEEWTNPASELLLSRGKGIWEDLRANIKWYKRNMRSTMTERLLTRQVSEWGI